MPEKRKGLNTASSDITQRKQTENESKLSVKRLMTLLDDAPIGICHTDLKGEMTYVNKRFERVSGYSREEVVGKNGLKLGMFPNETLKILGKRIIERLMGKPPAVLETQFKCKDGHLIWVAIEAELIKEQGIPVGFQIVSRDITEGKRMEEEIQQQNEFLNNILDSLTHPFYVVDANDYTIKMANPAAKLGNLSKKPTCYVLTHKSVKPCGGVAHVCPLEEVKKTKKPVAVEHIHYDKDGNARNVEVHGFPIFDTEGNVIQMIEYCLDITERKRAEEALEQSQKRLQALMEESPVIICRIDLKGKVTYVNKKFEEVTGYHREEVLGRSGFGLGVFHKETIKLLSKRLEEKLMGKTPSPMEIQFKGKDGEWIWVSGIGELVREHGKPVGIQIVAQDITERKQAEEVLKESETKFKTIVQNIWDVVFQLSPLGIIQYVSPKVQEVYGYKPEDLIGKHLKKTTPISELPKALDVLKTVLSGKVINNFEINQLDDKGRIVPTEINIAPVRSEGKIIAVQGVMRDITQRKQAEEALRQAQTELERRVEERTAELTKANEELQIEITERQRMEQEIQDKNEQLDAQNEQLRAAYKELRQAQEQLVRSERLAAIGQLAGGVGHELRNPLGAIKNAVYYIKGKVANSELAQKEPRVMQFLNIADEEINSSTKIINDLLGFSRVGKPAVSPARIKRVIEDALSHLTIPENIEVANRLDADLPEIEIDTDQLHQVLVNIIMNAVQAMPGGGKLTIGAKTRDKFLEVEISDTGCGIPQEAIGKIFDPLFTTRAKGIGLGLAVSKTIIDRHEGHIKVESEVGKGTTFIIKLPLKAD